MLAANGFVSVCGIFNGCCGTMGFYCDDEVYGGVTIWCYDNLAK